MKAMILAAGLGSRLKPITDKLPKPLIDVGGISLIERSINQLISFGVNEFIINVSYLGDQIKESLQSIDAISKIIFIDEPFPYGTGGALVNAKSFLGNDPFILSTADIIFDLSGTEFIDSSGIGFLVFMLKRLRPKNRTIHILGLNGQPKKVVQMLRINRMIRCLNCLSELKTTSAEDGELKVKKLASQSRAF